MRPLFSLRVLVQGQLQTGKWANEKGEERSTTWDKTQQGRRSFSLTRFIPRW